MWFLSSTTKRVIYKIVLPLENSSNENYWDLLYVNSAFVKVSSLAWGEKYLQMDYEGYILNHMH